MAAPTRVQVDPDKLAPTEPDNDQSAITNRSLRRQVRPQ